MIFRNPRLAFNPKTFANLFLCCLLFLKINLSAQPIITANDKVIPYSGAVRPGYNPGYYPGWNDQSLANLAAGNPAAGVAGAGAKTVRQGLYFELLRTWGFGVRLPEVAHFQSLGMGELTGLILGGADGGSQPYPPSDVRDPMEYCPGRQSHLFANLYKPIWDNGANGTPYDDQNYFAAYVYETVKTYKDHVRFWEIWNEPGFDLTGDTGWRPKNDPAGNWWNTNPDPCDYRLQAPVFHYVRMLRIAWEIIKTLDPDSYVCLSSPGYQSFLDAILRNTDNPTNGAFSNLYPNQGGAYFDCVAYHSYPHFDGSTVLDANPPGVFMRNSDRCADGIVDKRNYFQQALSQRGYDGITFPKKEFIVTEINLPRKSFTSPAYFGSALAQRNFVIKSLVNAKKERIHQLHWFTLAEQKTETAANYEFNLMGLYKNLDNVPPAGVQLNEEGIALKTASDLLFETTFDSLQTSKLNPPAGVRAEVFLRPDAQHVFVLWAKTLTDLSENASKNYSLPASVILKNGLKYEWDWSQTGSTAATTGQNLALSGTPIFIVGKLTSGAAQPDFSNFDLKISPNPVAERSQITFNFSENADAEFSIFDATGRLQEVVFSGYLTSGEQSFFVETENWPPGVYFLQAKTSGKTAVAKMIK